MNITEVNVIYVTQPCVVCVFNLTSKYFKQICTIRDNDFRTRVSEGKKLLNYKNYNLSCQIFIQTKG